ncbi:MAG: hypothetical protein Ct9H300mP21_03300 [Pseudomonadota bacterium]|nr:MAG: hypothetical protein Ct9H300mP21_03300 [Pseudomonadota bacterium]
MIEYYVHNASSFAAGIDNLFFVITLISDSGFFWFWNFCYFLLRYRGKRVKAKNITGEKHSETKWTHYPHYAVIAMDVVIIAVNI